MRAFVLMTAMPPTKGHLHLVEFANQLADAVTVIVVTQPQEPMGYERWGSMVSACAYMPKVKVIRHNNVVQDDPASPGFWDFWQQFMRQYGVTPSDVMVSSEPYGQKLAEVTGSNFIPYDPQRQLYYTKATRIRDEYDTFFADILPEFQKFLRKTVTLFGAESTGKTTLSEALSRRVNGHWLFEWARPYLELVGPDIHVKAMQDIWHGQAAIQRHTAKWIDKPWVIQDTDLFSTVGYWEQPHWTKDLGPVPEALVKEAVELKSDLYIIPQSNIPFEEDPIRYGGDRRESPDSYWISIAREYELNYVVLQRNTPRERLLESQIEIERLARRVQEKILFDRQGR